MLTSPLICYANQWTGFYMIGTSVKEELNVKYFSLNINAVLLNAKLHFCYN